MMKVIRSLKVVLASVAITSVLTACPPVSKKTQPRKDPTSYSPPYPSKTSPRSPQPDYGPWDFPVAADDGAGPSPGKNHFDPKANDPLQGPVVHVDSHPFLESIESRL